MILTGDPDAEGNPAREWIVKDAKGIEVYRTRDLEAAQIAMIEASALNERQAMIAEQEAAQSDEGQIAAAREAAQNDLFGIPVGGKTSADEQAANSGVFESGGNERSPGNSGDREIASQEARAARPAFQSLGFRLVPKPGRSFAAVESPRDSAACVLAARPASSSRMPFFNAITIYPASA